MARSMHSRITMNGKPLEIDGDITLAGLLAGRGVNPQRVVVELNRRIVPREEYPSTLLAGGDVLEVVTFVGGG